MGNHPGLRQSVFVGIVVISLGLAFLAAIIPRVGAQSASQAPPVPQWQKDAGGRMEFDVASVKLNTSGVPPSGDMPYSNFPLGPGDVYNPNGGLFTATNLPLISFLAFAYKMSVFEINSARSQLPKWAVSDRFNIQARTQGNPTKNQMRLMMQSLLSDRFKLLMHKETKDVPIFGLVLADQGKQGPGLRVHSDSGACPTALPATPAATPIDTVDGQFPIVCGGFLGLQPSVPGRIRMGARNVRMDAFIIGMGNAYPTLNSRPIIDETGLSGTFDFAFEWTPENNGRTIPGEEAQADPSGSTFLETLKEQLGLKLESKTGPAEAIVIDHIEQPSEN